MALVARVKSPDWASGDTLTAADLKAEFNNLINALTGTNDVTVKNLSATGDATLGDSGADTVTINGAATANAMSIATANIAGGVAVLTTANVTTVNATTVIATTANSTTSNITTGNITTANITTANVGTLVATTVGAATANVVAAARTRVVSAAAGVGQIAISTNSSGNYTNTGTSFQAVTNLSVTLATSGRPVVVMLISDGTTSVSGLQTSFVSGTNEIAVESQFQFMRDGSSLGVSRLFHSFLSSSSTYHAIIVPPATMTTIDTVGAGTYTYTLQAKSTSSAPVTSTGVQYCKLVAYEL